MIRLSKKELATQLRHRVTIQNYTPTSDGEGGKIDAWTDVRTVWAGVNPIRAAERNDYDSLNEEVTHAVRFRGNIDINSTQRIKHGSRYLEVKTVENIQERDVLKVVTCRELSR